MAEIFAPLTLALFHKEWDAAYKLLAENPGYRLGGTSLISTGLAPSDAMPLFLFEELCKRVTVEALQELRLQLCRDREVGLLGALHLRRPASASEVVVLLYSLEQFDVGVARQLLAFYPLGTHAESVLANCASFGSEDHMELVLQRVLPAAVGAIMARLEDGTLPPPTDTNSLLALIERGAKFASDRFYVNICALAEHRDYEWPLQLLRTLLRASLNAGVSVDLTQDAVLPALADIDIGADLFVDMFDNAAVAAKRTPMACAHMLFVLKHEGKTLMHRLCQLTGAVRGPEHVVAVFLKRYATKIRDAGFLIDTEDAHGMAAIDHALEHDNTVAVARMLRYGSDPNRKHLLLRAIERQNVTIVKRLLENGATDISLALDADGEPLFNPLRMGHAMRVFLTLHSELFGSSYVGIALYFATKSFEGKVGVEIGRNPTADDLQRWSQDIPDRASLTLSFAGEVATGDGVERDCLCELFKCCLKLMTVEVGDGCTISGGAPDWCLTTFGVLLGHSLVKRIPLPATLSHSFVARMMNRDFHFADLKAYDPALYRTLLTLRDCSAEDLGEFELTMSDEVPIANTKKRRMVEFVDGGDSIPVTHDNLDEYLDFRTKHVICAENNQAFEAVMRSFSTVVTIPDRLETSFVLRLFCGSPTIDVATWKSNTNLSGNWRDGYIEMFWDMVQGWDHATRSELLQFCTGSSREPAVGFKNLLGYCGKRMLFTINEGAPGRMPSTQTCFNTLSLPLYADRDILEAKMKEAFKNHSLED